MLFLCLQTRNNCISSSGLKNFKILIKASSSKSTKLAIASYQLDKNMLQLRYLMLCDALSDLVPQFKYHKKHPWRSVTFSKTSKFTHSSMCVFHVFCIVKMIPNCAKRLILAMKNMNKLLCAQKDRKIITRNKYYPNKSVQV